jgi:preprotein translocase subunit SecA
MGKPIDIYKKEAFSMFEAMVGTVDREIVSLVYKLQVNVPERQQELQRRAASNVVASHAESTGMGYSGGGGAATATATEESGAPMGNPITGRSNNLMERASQAGSQAQTIKRAEPKVGRNDPCPCGSGKKYKKCHGANEV